MSTPAAGWYVDTTDPGLVRWWDGSAWSDHTQPNPEPPAAAPVDAVIAAPVPAASVPLVPSAPYVPPPFADPPPPAPVAAPVAAALDYPPPAFGSPGFAEPSASAAPAAAPGSTAPGSAAPGTAAPGSAAPGPRRVGSSLPISEPVRLTPPASGAIPVAGFPGFDDPMPAAKPSTTPPPLAVPSQPGSEAPGAGKPGTFAVTPLATATPMPASASTPWTSSTTFAQPTSAVDLASVDYEPMTRTWGSTRAVGAPRAVTGVSTGGAWMLALSPVLHLGLAALGWLLTEGGASTNTPYVSGGLGTVAVLWVVLGTITDYRRLGALGHEFRPSPAWILLGPFFYLLVRAIHVFRTTRSGTAPTWVYVVTAVLVSALVSALALLQPREASLGDLRTVESTIASDLQAEGFDYTVLCPSQATVTIGASFVCTAYDEVGPASLIRVTWTGVGGEFTYAFESAPSVSG